MNFFYHQLKANLGLSLILFIGLGVEFSNFQAMFFRFMSSYRPTWGAFNHLPAIFLSAFLLLCIVIFGIRKQTSLSWFLALLTCVISFSVYSRMNLSWQWEEMHEIHFVVLILSAMLPMLVAYTTHQIAQTDEIDDFDQLPSAEEARRLQQAQQRHRQAAAEHKHQQNATHAHANSANFPPQTNQHTQPYYHHAPTYAHHFQAETGTKRKNYVNYEVNQMIKPEKETPMPPPPIVEQPFTHTFEHQANYAPVQDLVVQPCEECNSPMHNKRKGTKYCSKTCSLAAQKRRKAMEKEELANAKVSPAVQMQPRTKEVAFEVENASNLEGKKQATTPTTQENAEKSPSVMQSILNFATKEIKEIKTIRENKIVEEQPKTGNLQQNQSNFNLAANLAAYEKAMHQAVANENIVPETTFVCEHCGKPTQRKNIHSRFCSENCRIHALKARKKSDFFVQADDFDTNGVIAWKNPAK